MPFQIMSKSVQQMPFATVEAEGKPNKKSKKGGAKGPVAILKESIQLGCVSQDSHPRKSILREPGKLGTKHAVKFFHREVLSKSVRLMSVVLARQNSRKIT